MNDSQNQPIVTFIIPHRGRTDLLLSTVKSIENQAFQLEKLNVLIITQDPAERVQPLFLNQAVSVDVLQRTQSETISSMRNFGVQQTDAQYLAFIDADIILSPDWTATMIETLCNNPDYSLVSAPQRAGDTPTHVEKIRIAVGNSIGGVSVSSLPGHNLFLKRETFDLVGGFPAHLSTCEDYCFTVSIQKHGKLYVTDHSWYIHAGEDRSFSQVFKKEYWRAGSNLQSLRGRRIPLREYPSIFLPFWFLIALGIILVGLTKFSFPCIICGLAIYFLPIFLYTFRIVKRAPDSKWTSVFLFYTLYHSARSFGTIAGLQFLFKRKKLA